MQIERITVTQFTVPLEEPFVTALRPVPELERVLVEIETDTGLVGVGEGAPGPRVTGETQSTVATVVEDWLAPAIVGKNPLHIEQLVDVMNTTLADAPTAKAAVETALQDLRGKHAEQPLYEVLGGYADEPVLSAPKVLSLDSPDAMATKAAEAVDCGYRQCKIKLGDDPQIDIERVRAIVEAVPEDVSLKADANQGWQDMKTAASVLRDSATHLDVIEQPVTEGNVADLQLLRRRFDVPVMPDESVHSVNDMLSLIREGAGDCYNIKLMKTGGIRDAIRLNAIAAADDRPTQIGSMVEGHVGTAAGVHFALAFKNVVWNEMVGPFMTTTGITDLDFDEPRITVDGPGLGVSIDRDRLAEYTVERTVIEQ